MKYLLLLLTISGLALAEQNSCGIKEQDVNTPVPTELKDGEIVTMTKDGKKTTVSSNEYKVVKRKQQFKVKEIVNTEPCVVINQDHEERKNMLMLGATRGYTTLDTTYNANEATVSKRDGLIFDLSYLRRQLFDTRIGAGLGLDTRSSVRGFVGLEF